MAKLLSLGQELLFCKCSFACPGGCFPSALHRNVDEMRSSAVTSSVTRARGCNHIEKHLDYAPWALLVFVVPGMVLVRASHRF
jgi:hypothetical protein